MERLRADCMGMRRGELEKLADVIGIKHSTFRRIVAGTDHNYRYVNVKRIEDYYASLPARLTLDTKPQAHATHSRRGQLG